MEDKQKVLQCYYCGNSTLMNLVGEHVFYWDEDYGYYGHMKYQMYACPVCGKVTFYRKSWDCSQTCVNEEGEIDEYYNEDILYPVNTLQGEYLPTKVKEAYEAALKTKNIDSAVCLIALRRTLEIICAEKAAQGRDLWHRIEYLANQGILPQELKHASNITKNYGNMGAHDSNFNINAIELERNIEFVKYILDYLYVLPAKLNAIQEQLENKSTPQQKF